MTQHIYTWRDELKAAVVYGILGSILTLVLLAWWFV